MVFFFLVGCPGGHGFMGWLVEKLAAQCVGIDGALIEHVLEVVGVQVVAGDHDDAARWYIWPPFAAGLKPDGGADTFNCYAFLRVVGEPDVATHPAGTFNDVG